MTGRPRSDEARRAVLDAAAALAARDGYTAVTIKGIAETAGVGRQTVYRWWPSRGAVLLEALAEIGREHGAPETTEDPRADLRAFLTTTFTLVAKPPVANVLLGLTADSFSDPGLSREVRVYIAWRRRILGELLARCGGWRVPVDTIVDLVFGTMWYRLIHEHAPVGPDLADELEPVLAALRADPAG